MILVDAVLVLAVVLLLLLVWAVVQHLILGVPFVPAPDAAIVAALTALGLRPGDIFCDLGAGDGRVLTVASRQPGVTLRGVEAVWPVWLNGKIRLFVTRTPAVFTCADARTTDIHDVTAVFLYLTPALLAELSPKLQAELPPGARIASLTFALPGFTPVAEQVVPTWRGPQTVWLYRR